MDNEKETQNLSCVYMKLSQQNISFGEPLNVLVLVKNTSEQEITARIHLFLSPADSADDFREGVSGIRTIGASHIEHLYFSIPPEHFAADYWDGVSHEEFIVAGGSTPQQAAENRAARKMVFIGV